MLLLLPYTEYLGRLSEPRNIADLILVFLLVYAVLKLVRGTRAAPMAAAIGIFALLYWVAAQQNLATLEFILRGALLYIGVAIIVLFLLAYIVREHGRPGFNFALAAAILYAAAFALWWVLVYPANVELAKWVNGPVPADWTEVRSRWECGHAIISLIELLGFAALIWSVLMDTSRPAKQRTKRVPPRKRAR